MNNEVATIFQDDTLAVDNDFFISLQEIIKD